MSLGYVFDRRGLAMVCFVALSVAGCAGLARDDQGVLQPQMVRGPCDVKKFFLLDHTAVHTDLAERADGGTCIFTVLNPNLQAFPTAVIVSDPPLHGRATAGVTNGGRSAIVSYAPQAGYSGTDRFAVTIEPNDHAILVAVTVQAAGAGVPPGSAP